MADHHPLAQNGPVGSIDPAVTPVPPIDPELDEAMGGFAEHRWENTMYGLAHKYGLANDSTLQDVGQWLVTHGKKGTQDYADWQEAVKQHAELFRVPRGYRRRTT